MKVGLKLLYVALFLLASPFAFAASAKHKLPSNYNEGVTCTTPSNTAFMHGTDGVTPSYFSMFPSNSGRPKVEYIYKTNFLTSHGMASRSKTVTARTKLKTIKRTSQRLVQALRVRMPYSPDGKTYALVNLNLTMTRAGARKAEGVVIDMPNNVKAVFTCAYDLPKVK